MEGDSLHKSNQAAGSELKDALLVGLVVYTRSILGMYWIEFVVKVTTQVQIAGEYRYRDSVPYPNTLVVTITQSGETAATLAALKRARSLGKVHTLTICNVAPAPWCESVR